MAVGSSYVLKIQMLGAVSTYLFFLIVSRKFGPEAVGIFNIAYTLLFVLVMLAKLGMDNALVVFITAAIKDALPAKGASIYYACMRLVIAVGLALAVLTYLVAPLLAELFKNDQLLVPLRIMACLLVPFLFSNLTAHALRGFGYIRDFALFQNSNYFLVAIILILAGQSYIHNNYLPEYAWAGAVCLGFFISLYLVARRIKGYRSRAFFHISYRKMLTVSMPMLLTSSMFTMLSWTDTLFLGYYCPESDVGIYNVVKKISLLITISLFAVNAIAEKQFARFYVQHDTEALKRLGLQIAWVNTLCAAPIFLAIALFPLFFINFFGPDFSAGKLSLIILCVTQLCSAICGSVLNLLNMAGHERVVSRILTGATLANLGLNIWLIPLLGMHGAAISSLVSTLGWGLAGLYYVRKHFKFWMLPC